MTSYSLVNELNNYNPVDTIEKGFIKRFLDLLQHPKAFDRDHLPGHITGSVWIVDRSKQYVLLTHHAKLNRWLQPGGHADGDANVLRVALREAEEETGLTDLSLLSNSIFDIDIHTIPARKDFPEHDHYDVRFILEGNQNKPFTITEESHDLKWIPIQDIIKYTGDNQSIVRMAEKTKALLRADQ